VTAENLETPLTVTGVAQSCVPLCAYVPQWRKLLKTRRSGAISLSSWANWACSYSVALFYSSTLLLVTGRGWPMVITTSLGLMFVLSTMGLVWRFRER
jgi:uncharacterized protein with PQ loop repeat